MNRDEKANKVFSLICEHKGEDAWTLANKIVTALDGEGRMMVCLDKRCKNYHSEPHEKVAHHCDREPKCIPVESAQRPDGMKDATVKEITHGTGCDCFVCKSKRAVESTKPTCPKCGFTINGNYPTKCDCKDEGGIELLEEGNNPTRVLLKLNEVIRKVNKGGK